MQCHPCQIEYDFYLETDHLAEELPFVLDELGIQNPPMEKQKLGRNSHEKTKNERKAKAIAGVSASTYEKLIKRFQNDFEIFGYPILTFQQFQQKYGGAD